MAKIIIHYDKGMTSSRKQVQIIRGYDEWRGGETRCILSGSRWTMRYSAFTVV
jgi:hypothetical protein